MHGGNAGTLDYKKTPVTFVNGVFIALSVQLELVSGHFEQAVCTAFHCF